MSEVPDETPWVCCNCGKRDYNLDSWLLVDGDLYCDECEATWHPDWWLTQ